MDKARRGGMRSVEEGGMGSGEEGWDQARRDG